MARIKDSSVEAVKQVADIVVLVEARTKLRKVGGRYTGLCPFHQEKTPSFSVSPDRGTYHCFGCGVGGDAISFIQELESLDFVGTIEWLAGRFNIELEDEESSPEADA
jgi:DNA primase